MLDKVIEKKKVVLIVTILLGIFSVIGFSRSVENLGFEFVEHKAVELNLIGKDQNYVQEKAGQVSSDYEIVRYEQGRYLVRFDLRVDDNSIEQAFELEEQQESNETGEESSAEELEGSENTIENINIDGNNDEESGPEETIAIYESRQIFSFDLITNVSYLALGSLLLILLLSFFYDSELKRYERLSIASIMFLRVIFEVVIISGLTFLISLLGLFEINFWVVELLFGLALFSFILKVLEYIYFSSFSKTFLGKNTQDEYKNYVETFFSSFLLITSFVAILIIGLYITFNAPFIYGAIVVFIATLIILFSYLAWGYLIVESVVTYLSNNSFVKNNKFLKK